CTPLFSQPYTETISSPDEGIHVEVTLTQGQLFYTLSKKKRLILDTSRLGLELKEGNLSSKLTYHSSTTSSFDETWTQPWGEVKDIRNHYNELNLELEQEETGRRMNVVFRVFDYGIGFRYEWPEQENLDEFVILDELTEFNLADDPQSWWIKAYILNRYEHLYEKSEVSRIDTVQTPFTMETQDGLFLSIHEAALTDYASMTLARTGGTKLEADLVPWLNGDKVRAKAPHVSPWRTIQVAEKAGDLITDYLILNLNEPSRIENTDWIKPAKYTGIWWDMHLGTKTWGSGPNHGATTEYTKELIDFTSKHGFYGVLVEGWNTGWDGSWFENGDVFSFTEPYPDFDIVEVTRYAEEKGVKLIGHHETSAGISNYERQVDDAFAFYREHGVEAIKTGYVGDFVEGGRWHHGQFMVRHYRSIVEKAAKANIMLDVHEPIKATGIRRTWPNMMTREGARGQEYNAWSVDGGNPPSHTVLLPFTRLLGGPMDYTPGVFDLLLNDKPENPNNNRVQSTIAKELALYIVLYSPMQMVADLPKNLEANPVALDFVKDVPVDWDETRVPRAEVGEYIVTVRKDRNSSDWYLGAITNENARSFDLKMDFLEPGKNYTAYIYSDGAGADWETRPYLMMKYNQTVTAGMDLRINLAPGGGMAVRFTEQ
ncbi:MAG: glycoside hydrolase family 97 protein, partial [Bacteroidota bacterium]